EAEPIAFLGGHLRAEDQVLEGKAAPDQPREALGAAEARNDAQVRLGLPHTCRLLEDADVTGHGDLAAASQGMAADGRDHRLRKALEPPEDRVAEAEERGTVG